MVGSSTVGEGEDNEDRLDTYDSSDTDKEKREKGVKEKDTTVLHFGEYYF